MKIGEKKTLNIAARDAYGEYDPKNLQDVPREQLADFEKNGIKLEVGAKIPTMMGPLEIKKVTKDTITLDVNHFLAGKDLIFDIELVGFSN
jgi:peptidylprolyl isomerase